MTASKDKVRAFVAVNLPDSARAALAETMSGLKGAMPEGVRWVDPSGIHLTLKFLGNIDAGLIQPVRLAMEQGAAAFNGPSFQLRLSGLGVFPHRKEPRVLWAGITGDLAALTGLQVCVAEALAEFDFAGERRPFRPHLTLGRVRGSVSPTARRAISQAIAEAGRPADISWTVEAIHLIRSSLTPRGASYTSMGSQTLFHTA